jgi:anaerobic ribonucleoside-triphosphate reductase
MDEKEHEVAREYIEHRSQRDIARNAQSTLTTSIKGLMNQTDSSLLEENANKDGKKIQRTKRSFGWNYFQRIWT